MDLIYSSRHIGICKLVFHMHRCRLFVQLHVQTCMKTLHKNLYDVMQCQDELLL